MSPSQHCDDDLLHILCPGHDAPPPVPLLQGHLWWVPEGQGALRRHCDITDPDSHPLHHRHHPQIQTATIRTLCHQGKNLGVSAGSENPTITAVNGLSRVVWAFCVSFFLCLKKKKVCYWYNLLHETLMHMRVFLTAGKKGNHHTQHTIILINKIKLLSCTY